MPLLPIRSSLAEARRPTQMAAALQNLQQAMTQCADAIFITDPSGIITRVNPAFEALTGYPALEAVGKDLSTFTEGPQSREYQQIWRHVYEQKQYVGLFKLRSQSDRLLNVEATITPVFAGRGQIASLVGTACLAEPVEAAPPPEASPSDNALVARLIHDLRNILFVALAQEDKASRCLPEDHPARRHAEDAKSAIKDAAALVHEFAQRTPPHAAAETLSRSVASGSFTD